MLVCLACCTFILQCSANATQQFVSHRRLRRRFFLTPPSAPAGRRKQGRCGSHQWHLAPSLHVWVHVGHLWAFCQWIVWRGAGLSGTHFCLNRFVRRWSVTLIRARWVCGFVAPHTAKLHGNDMREGREAPERHQCSSPTRHSNRAVECDVHRQPR